MEMCEFFESEEPKNIDLKNLRLSWFPWNGSKRWLVPRLIPLAQVWGGTGRFLEPFVGGGSVSYMVRGLYPEITQIVGEANPWLASAYCWQVLGQKPELKASLLTRDWIMEQRALSDESLKNMTEAEKALRFAVCLHTAWGNRWETHPSGVFRSTVNQKFMEPAFLLRKLDKFFSTKWLGEQDRVIVGDWETLLQEAKEGDLVYLDPPYPETLGYGNQFWDFANHLDTIDWVADQIRNQTGVSILVSNLASVERLYRRLGMDIWIIQGPKRSKTRAKRQEVLAWFKA